MNKRKSLEDTCSVFLSRRRARSPLAHQRAVASRFPHYAPPLRAESITVPPCFPHSAPLEAPAPPTTVLTAGSTKQLPLPGSSGALQPKPIRLANGRRHVPRPRNPFILFRCDLVHQRKTLPRSDMDDTNISRIAGDIWREMTPSQKKPWVELAAKEKAHHALLYPDYKYAPIHSGSKGKKINGDEAYLEDHPPRQVFQMGAASPSVRPRPRHHTERPEPYPRRPIPRRSSSCPPVGAVPVSSHSPAEEWTPPLATRDDMRRRSSRTIMYQSVATHPVVEPTAPALTDYDPFLPLQDFDWQSLPPVDPSFTDPTYLLVDPSQNTDACGMSNFGFFDNKSTYAPGVGDHYYTAHELGQLTVDTTFTDPFSTLPTLPADNNFPYGYSTAIPPFDFSAYIANSPSTPSSSGTSSK